MMTNDLMDMLDKAQPGKGSRAVISQTKQNAKITCRQVGCAIPAYLFYLVLVS